MPGAGVEAQCLDIEAMCPYGMVFFSFLIIAIILIKAAARTQPSSHIFYVGWMSSILSIAIIKNMKINKVLY